jgi:hypothetical protein
MNWCVSPNMAPVKKCVKTEISLLHSQPFKMSKCTVPKDNSNAVENKSWILTHRPSKISPSTCAAFISITDVVGLPVQSSSWMSNQPFSISVHHFLIWCTFSLHHHHNHTSTGGEFQLGNRFYPQKPHHTTKFPMLLPSDIQLSHEKHPADWLTCAQPAACYPYNKRYLLLQNKMLD